MRKFFGKINGSLAREAFFCMLFSFVILGLVSLIGLNLSFFTPFNNAFKDFSYLDLYYSEKLNNTSGDVNQNIILVNINRLERYQIAEVINRLSREKPSVIGLDIIFKEEKSLSGDKALAESLRKPNVVTTYAITNEGIINSSNKIIDSDQIIGYGNFSFDSETAVVRNFQGYREVGDSVQVSLGVAVAKAFLNGDWETDLEIYLQKERPINYKGNRNHFLILESDDILAQERLSIVKDKIVLLGYLGDSRNHQYDIEDKHFTPMNEKFVGKSAPDTFGVVIHANIINMIIANDFISVVPDWVLVLLGILFTYLGLIYFIWIAKRGLASYVLRLNIVRLVFIVFFVWLALLLFRNGIFLKTAGIIAVAAFSIGLIGYYKKLVHILHKKFKWNGYFFQD